jgi:hypothetical protein
MTEQQMAGLNFFYQQNPNGLDLNLGGIGGGIGGEMGGIGGEMGGIGGGIGGTPYKVTPVEPVANLVGTSGGPRVADPVNVRAASKYALTGNVPVTPVNPGNPFARPDSQQGIGSLAGGG